MDAWTDGWAECEMLVSSAKWFIQEFERERVGGGGGGAQAAAREGSEAAAEVLLAFGAKIMVCSD